MNKKIAIGSSVLLAVSLFTVLTFLYPVTASNGAPSFEKTWVCDGKEACNYDGGQRVWFCDDSLGCGESECGYKTQLMADGCWDYCYREYRYEFSAPREGTYKCEVKVTVSQFDHREDNPQYNEKSDVYLNGEKVGTTDDPWCPQTPNGNGNGNGGETADFVFDLQQPVDDKGGIFVHDLNGDGKFDFVVTSTGYIGAYDDQGNNLWVKNVNIKMWNYMFHPSAIAGDMDGDGKQEVAYLTTGNSIKILDGTTGTEEKTLSTGGIPIGMAIANLRGNGDQDAIVQYSKTELKAIRLDNGNQLWQTTQYRGIDHSLLRQADLDGDGLDEVAGASIIDHDGTKMNSWDLGNVYQWIDSMVIADIVSGGPLEVALADQGDKKTIVVDQNNIVYSKRVDSGCKYSHAPEPEPFNQNLVDDPDKVAVGNFQLGSGLEVFARSACGRDPWVLDSQGNEIASWRVDDSAGKPSDWAVVDDRPRGIDMVIRIDWDGDNKHEIVAKERHKNGRGAIINPLTGGFRKIFEGKAMRIYAADIRGDYREEVITVDESGKVKVWWNHDSNSNTKPRYWEQQHYKRQKQNWNYYSP